MTIRNINEARERIQMLSMAQHIKALLLQHGVDALVRGVARVYRAEMVDRLASSGVQRRIALLDACARGLAGEDSHGR